MSDCFDSSFGACIARGRMDVSAHAEMSAYYSRTPVGKVRRHEMGLHSTRCYSSVIKSKEFIDGWIIVLSTIASILEANKVPTVNHIKTRILQENENSAAYETFLRSGGQVDFCR